LRLNLGCGMDLRPGWTNCDRAALPGVDVVADLETDLLPYTNDSVDEFLLSHVIEHIHNVLPMMQELHRIAKPGAKMTVRVPYGSSDDAWEDPTHARPYFLNSWSAFAQPYFWRVAEPGGINGYGYYGDWQVKQVTLRLSRHCTAVDVKDAMQEITTQRNMVTEMVAELVAVKPAREARKELQEVPEVVLVR
jgi:SAM-dependent methyltransferase